MDDFDAVHHTLANLPADEGLSPAYLTAQTGETQIVLDAINSQLSARVMRSYGAFVHGMAQVQQLESDLVLTAILCRSARRHLGRVQGSLVHGGIRLLSTLRRRRVLESLVATLKTLSALSDGINMVDRLLKPPSGITALPAAAKLLLQCEAWAAKLDGFHIVRTVQPRLRKAGERLNATMFKALQAVCVCFDSEQYGAALAAAIVLGKVRVLKRWLNCSPSVALI